MKARKGSDGENYRQEMKETIFDTIIQMLEDKPYSDIETSEICEKAFISRQTFYRYFQNKDNVVRWKTKQLLCNGIGRIGRDLSWEDGLTVTLAGMYRYRTFFSDLQYAEFVAKFIDYCTEVEGGLFIETISRYKYEPLTPLLEFQIESLCIAQGYMTRKWCIDNMQLSPREFASYLSSIVPYHLYHLLKLE